MRLQKHAFSLFLSSGYLAGAAVAQAPVEAPLLSPMQFVITPADAGPTSVPKSPVMFDLDLDRQDRGSLHGLLPVRLRQLEEAEPHSAVRDPLGQLQHARRKESVPALQGAESRGRRAQNAAPDSSTATTSRLA